MAKATASKKQSKPSRDGFLGTWELQPGASKFQVDNPPKKATLTVDKEKGGLFLKVEWLDPASKKGLLEHSLTFDKPVLVNGAEVTLTQPDDATLETVVQKDGAVIARTKRTLSDDGKTMSFTQTGYLPNGKEFSNLSVFGKVR